MDEKYMKRALELAKKGLGKVNPNPLVGAVIVKNGNIIGEGYHEYFGGNHAEVNAVNNSNEDLVGATIYVTLEPCCHYGKTPPCTELIISKGISKVVIGALDPNPLVSGKGVKQLEAAGIDVVLNVLKDECTSLNNVFNKYIKTKLPYVVLKGGMSLDGKIAIESGESKWITSEESRKHSRQTRCVLSAIMVGVGTVINDNPLLTSRIHDKKDPIRVVVDTNLRIPLESNVIKNNRDNLTIIATTSNNGKNTKELIKMGVKILKVKEKEGKVDLRDLMIKLGNLGIDSLLIEGGGRLNFSALKEGIVDEVRFYISPKIIGGEKSIGIIGGEGIEKLDKAFKVKNLNVEFIDEDILIKGFL